MSLSVVENNDAWLPSALNSQWEDDDCEEYIDEQDIITSNARTARRLNTSISLGGTGSMSASIDDPTEIMFPPVRFEVFSRRYKTNVVSIHDADLVTPSWRRIGLDVVNADSAGVHNLLKQPLCGFPNTSLQLKGDSNRSGSVILRVEMREFITSVSALGMVPKYGVIKLSQYKINSQGKGRFTQTTSPLSAADPANTEASMLRAFRKLVLRNITPCIPLLYTYTIVDWKTVAEGRHHLFADWFAALRKDVPLAREECMCMFMEYVKGGSLRSAVRKQPLHTNQWRVVLFQVFFCLAVLDDAYMYRHNDLHMANIALHFRKVQKGQITKYRFKNTEYYVPNMGIEARLMDFDWSVAQGFPNGKIRYALEKCMSVATPEDPNVFDTHRLLLVIYMYAGTPLPIRHWIRSMYHPISPHLLSDKNNKHLHDYRLLRTSSLLSQMPTPVDVLNSSLFSGFKTSDPLKSVVPPEFVYEGRSSVLDV